MYAAIAPLCETKAIDICFHSLVWDKGNRYQASVTATNKTIGTVQWNPPPRRRAAKAATADVPVPAPLQNGSGSSGSSGSGSAGSASASNGNSGSSHAQPPAEPSG